MSEEKLILPELKILKLDLSSHDYYNDSHLKNCRAPESRDERANKTVLNVLKHLNLTRLDLYFQK